MSIILFISLFVCLYKSKFYTNPQRDYLKKRRSQSISGVFVLLVFLRHFGQYINIEKSDKLFYLFDQCMGQLIVIPFLFYSGYGVMKSIMIKGDSYVTAIPKHRILRVWLHFVIAVSMYLFLGIAMHRNYSLRRIVLSFIGLESIGNSNWYIFAIIAMYIFTWIAFKVFQKDTKKVLMLMLFFTLLYIGVWYGNTETQFYNTIHIYPFGMIYAYYQDRIDHFILRSNKRMFAILAILVVLLGVVRLSRLLIDCSFFMDLCLYWISGILFICCVLEMSLYVQFGNPVLDFLGTHIFEIYILQRIPMNLLYGMEKYLYFVVCLVITVLISIGYKFFEKKLDKFLKL